ncbi:hypothetical protein, partial [Hoeflea sp. AS16]|uniref:hypothetical protein n=1 Tax=Hoeflea sp. AS16 TaxID=3135779 RepID=UPI00316DAC56
CFRHLSQTQAEIPLIPAVQFSRATSPPPQHIVSEKSRLVLKHKQFEQDPLLIAIEKNWIGTIRQVHSFPNDYT